MITMIAAERLLIFDPARGGAPLLDFLKKLVPDVNFTVVDEAVIINQTYEELWDKVEI
jgi:hypothetical protein